MKNCPHSQGLQIAHRSLGKNTTTALKKAEVVLFEQPTVGLVSLFPAVNL